MRNHASPISPLASALIALAVSAFPSVAVAATTFTKDTATPFVSSITVRVVGDLTPVSPSIKTSGDIAVTVSIDPGTAPGVQYIIDSGSDTHVFTENGSFTFTFHDNFGGVGSSTVTVDNIDRTPPVITVDAYSTTPTTNDVVVSVSANEGTLNANSNTFTDNGSFDFVATDEAGNVSTSTITISHIDRTPPVISLLGGSIIQLRAGASFVDEGATASDNMSANVSVVTTGTVDTSTAGTYTRTYSAADEAGNEATPVTRRVEIVRSSSGGGGGGGSRTTSEVVAEPTGRVLGVSTYNFSRDLAPGDKGEDVLALQTALQAEGYFAEVPTGYYGPKTEAAVRLYQEKNGIPQSGVCGPLTRAALSGGTASVSGATAPLTVEAQIASLLAQLLILKEKLAALLAR